MCDISMKVYRDVRPSLLLIPSLLDDESTNNSIQFNSTLFGMTTFRYNKNIFKCYTRASSYSTVTNLHSIHIANRYTETYGTLTM